MNTVEEYFDQARRLIQGVLNARIERYEEHLLSTTRGNLRVRLRFFDNALLEISEAFILASGELHWLSYRYHYQDASETLVFRYDNAPHHPEVVTHPEHKHQREQILASGHPSLEQILEEVRTVRESVS